MRILPCGFDGALIEFSQRISPSIHRRTIRFSKAIEDARILGVLEVVPSYCSLLLRYDPCSPSLLRSLTRYAR
ncbi:MAG: carboxyltransferase domain-containing protein [Thermotogota bacterium]